MAKKNIAVLDFGSSAITVLIGDHSVNNSFDVRGYAEKNYSGFMNGEVLEPDELGTAITEVIKTAENNARCKITNLYVGVPAEFSVVEVRNAFTEFGKRKRINDGDVDAIFEKADEFRSSPTHIVVNRSPVCFELDTGERLIDPRGRLSASLRATVSFVLCERDFIGLVSQCLHNSKIPFVDFISETLAKALFLIEPSERDKSAILVDCGYLTTDVSVIVGDGIVDMHSFSLGGGHIVADFVRYLKIPYKIADELKKSIALTGRPGEKEKISINQNGEPMQFSALELYEVTEKKANKIAKMIQKSLNCCHYDFPDYLPIGLTGGGVSYIPGIKETITRITGRECNIIAPNVPQMNEPKSSTVLSLLDLALKQNKNRYSLFIKLFKKSY